LDNLADLVLRDKEGPSGYFLQEVRITENTIVTIKNNVLKLAFIIYLL
jgi:hypothetical protein